VRGRPGRPAEIYHGTELADVHFSRGAEGLAIELLELIEEEDPALLPRVLERRRGHRVDQVREQLAGSSFEQQVASLVRLLDDEGYLADSEQREDGTYAITLHNCAIWALASHYGQACSSELDFLREVLPEAQIDRCSHKVEGAFVCGYEISPRRS
jgi:predicted ArsR family transcriptional regulator